MATIQDVWTKFKSELQERMSTGYVRTWKFNRLKAQFTESQFPVVVAYPSSIDKEEYVAMPKQKIVNLIVTCSGKVMSTDGDALETEILKMDEYLKNALEADLQWDSGITIVNIGQSRFNLIEDTVGETTFDFIIATNKFTAGSR